MTETGLNVADLQIFLLVFARASGLFARAPLFGNRAVPTQVRVLLAAGVSLALVGDGATGAYQPPDAFGFFAVVLIKELAFGFLLGFISSLVFAGIQAAGHLIGLQSGFGLANVLDPLSGEQGSIIDQFYLIMAVLLFLAVNGHHQFLLALERSFTTVPIDGYAQPFAANAEELVAFLARTTSTVFEVGLRLAVAVGGALLITDVVMGLTARAIPQMNVFMVGAPLKLMVAMAGIVLALPTTAIAMVFAFDRVLTALNAVMQAF